jgi:hypothetical protein
MRFLQYPTPWRRLHFKELLLKSKFNDFDLVGKWGGYNKKPVANRETL